MTKQTKENVKSSTGVHYKEFRKIKAMGLKVLCLQDSNHVNTSKSARIHYTILPLHLI